MEDRYTPFDADIPFKCIQDKNNFAGCQCIEEFLEKFPDAVSDRASSRRSTGILAPADDADEVEVEDAASTMPP